MESPRATPKKIPLKIWKNHKNNLKILKNICLLQKKAVEEQRNNNNKKPGSKMTDKNPTISIITLNMIRLKYNKKADTAILKIRIQLYIIYRRHTLDLNTQTS